MRSVLGGDARHKGYFMPQHMDGPDSFVKKHLEKFLFVVGLLFYSSVFIDDRFQYWSFIGGYSTFIALLIIGRKRKGLPLINSSVLLMGACVILFLGIQILHYIRHME